MNLFSSVQLAPKDPIFGLTEAYVADQNPEKVNLGVGVYYTDEGKVPLLKAGLKPKKKSLPNNHHVAISQLRAQAPTTWAFKNSFLAKTPH